MSHLNYYGTGSVRGFPNGTNGKFTNGTIGSQMVPMVVNGTNQGPQGLLIGSPKTPVCGLGLPIFLGNLSKSPHRTATFFWNISPLGLLF